MKVVSAVKSFALLGVYSISLHTSLRVGTTEYCSSFRVENVSNKSITLLGEKVILVEEEDEEERELPVDEDMYCQRVYRFSVEVWPAPSGSVFRHTKVNLNLDWKTKYIVTMPMNILSLASQVQSIDNRRNRMSIRSTNPLLLRSIDRHSL